MSIPPLIYKLHKSRKCVCFPHHFVRRTSLSPWHRIKCNKYWFGGDWWVHWVGIPRKQELLISKLSSVLSDWLRWDRFLCILEYLEPWNARARTLSNAPFDREKTLNIPRGAGYEYAWIHGYTGSILRATVRNILENTDTNKQKQPSQTIQLKFEIHTQLLIQKG